MATRWKYGGPQNMNDFAAWFLSGRTSGNPWPFLPIVLVFDFLLIREALQGGPDFGLLLITAFLIFVTLVIALSCFLPLFYEPEPSPYLGEDRPLFDVSHAVQGSEQAVPLFPGSFAVMLRAPSSDPERLVRDLAEVTGIPPQLARVRVLGGGLQDVTSRGPRIAARVSALVHGPGQVLVAGVDEETAGIIAARLIGPWAQIEVVDGASRAIDDEAPQLSHGPGAPPAPIPAELRQFARRLAAAGDEQERRRKAGLPQRREAGWPTIAFVGLVLGFATLGVVGNSGDAVWAVSFFWLGWVYLVYKRLTYQPGDLTMTDLVRAARPTIEWLGEGRDVAEPQPGEGNPPAAALCTVRLWRVGLRPDDVAMAIGEMSGRSRLEAEELCDQAANGTHLATGVPVVEAVPPDVARATVNALTAAGAWVSVMSVPPPPTTQDPR